MYQWGSQPSSLRIGVGSTPLQRLVVINLTPTTCANQLAHGNNQYIYIY